MGDFERSQMDRYGKLWPSREEIAAAQNAEVAEARELLGPAKAYGKWVLIDTMGIEPDRVAFCCRREGDWNWSPTSEESFGDLETARRPDKFFEIKGERHYYMRYKSCFQSLVEYHPLSQEECDRRNATRKANKVRKELERDKAAMPLLADQIT